MDLRALGSGLIDKTKAARLLSGRSKEALGRRLNQ